ncbi:MAG TPA: Flp family type IVb pilin [Dehalococcoidia bacterium]|nr:Flp family type IVb pilin [Dehalococcoidia bacterium]
MTFINDILTKVWLGLKTLKDEHGQDLLEYALLGGFIAAAIVAAFLVFPGAVNSMVTNIKDCVDFTSTTNCDISGP